MKRDALSLKYGEPLPLANFQTQMTGEMVRLLTEKGKMGKEVGWGEAGGGDLFKTGKNGFQVRARNTSERS